MANYDLVSLKGNGQGPTAPGHRPASADAPMPVGRKQNQVVVRFWIISMMLVLIGLSTLKLR